jgi:hypothetical protein
VQPTPTVDAVADKLLCSGTPSGVIAFSGAVGGTVFNWTNSNPAIGLPASGSGFISFTAANAGAAPIGATIAVTPVANSCAGTAVSFAITVNPTPVLSSSLLPAAVCTGSPFDYTPASATAGTSFTWTRAGVTGISNAPASGSGAISEVLVNTTTAPLAVTYVYTLTALH